MAFGLHGGTSPVAFDIHLEDGCVMNKPVHRGKRHGRVRILGDVGQIVEDEQIELVELCNGGFELTSP